MIEIKENVTLAPYTTFHIGGPARYFSVVRNLDELKEALAFAREKEVPVFVLGGGSNILVSDGGYKGLVVSIESRGIEVLEETDGHVLVKMAAGENWDQFVRYAVEHGWWGIENLSHIPGSCGAFAVQNVGAYGQEAKETVVAVEVLDMADGTVKHIENKDCGFAYRSSIFNGSDKGRLVILSTTLRLNKNGKPNLSYKDLSEKFGETVPSLVQIREAVIEIRNKKFPFPSGGKNGSAGSFFKNLTLTKPQFDEMVGSVKRSFGDLTLLDLVKKVRISENKTEYKVPTAYLMDICGLKGLEMGGAKINPSQPLVLLNASGEAKARDVLTLAHVVAEAIRSKCGLEVAFEPELVGFEGQ